MVDEPAPPPRHRRRARAGGDGARAARALRARARARRRAYETPRCRSAHGQTISQPFMVADLPGLGLRGGERVLDVGTGLRLPGGGARRARRRGALDRADPRARRAARAHARAGGLRTRRRCTSATAGSACPSTRRTAGSPSRPPRPSVPQALYEQLERGRPIVVPVGAPRDAARSSCVVVRERREGRRVAALGAVPRSCRSSASRARRPASSRRSRSRLSVPPVLEPALLGSPGVSARSALRASGAWPARAGRSARHNWVQLVKFGVVGASGYVVNLAVYARCSAARTPLPARGDRLVRRRRDEQLLLEPALDVPRAARALRLPGHALPRRLAVALLANLLFLLRARRARPRQDRRAGDRDRPRDAAELRREQALVVPRR